MIYFPSESADTTYEENLTDADTGEEPVQLVVYVCGAVQDPGVVALDADARVVDAILAAGGMTEDASETYVNLAARLTDGEKIYVPTRAEAAELERAAAEQVKVNINTADKEELCTLPGIGESKAEDIIAYREKQGSFKNLEELMQVSGIKESLYEKLADRIKLE